VIKEILAEKRGTTREVFEFGVHTDTPIQIYEDPDNETGYNPECDMRREEVRQLLTAAAYEQWGSHATQGGVIWFSCRNVSDLTDCAVVISHNVICPVRSIVKTSPDSTISLSSKPMELSLHAISII
jgi:hypothetical protein